MTCIDHIIKRYAKQLPVFLNTVESVKSRCNLDTGSFLLRNSNNVIPTQRAIAAFLANRLSEGGSELETNQLVAGVTLLGSSQNLISTTSGAEILLPKLMKIQGNDANLSGSILAQTMLLRPNDDSNSVF